MPTVPKKENPRESEIGLASTWNKDAGRGGLDVLLITAATIRPLNYYFFFTNVIRTGSFRPLAGISSSCFW